MPQRNTSHQVSTPVQGDDAYAIIKRPTYGDIKMLTKEAKTLQSGQDSAMENLEFTSVLIRRFVMGWNWVDDNGEALPNPQSHPEIVDTLTTSEVAELCALIMGTEDIKKNAQT